MPSSDNGGGNTSSSHALLDGSCLANSSRKAITSAKGPSFFCNGISVAPWLQHDVISILVSSAPVSIIKASTSGDICMKKCNLLGHHLLPSVASSMHCKAHAQASSQATWSFTSTALSKNWPMFSMDREGGQKSVVPTANVHCQAASNHLANFLVP